MNPRRVTVGRAVVFLLAVVAKPSAALMPVVGEAVTFGVSSAVRDVRSAELSPVRIGPPAVRGIPLMRFRGAAATLLAERSAALSDLLLGAGAMPPASLSVEGLSSRDNATAFGFEVVPPDTNGDVGPDHYVQVVNSLVRVFDKAGSPVKTFKMSSLFTALGGICASNDDGDPIALYDPLADRWLISQFAIPLSSSGISHQCIAISQTGDPTGVYFLYDFVLPHFNDYPHFGVWPDGYYMASNQFSSSLSTGVFLGGAVFAFDRQRMLAGNPNPVFVSFQLPVSGGGLPSDIDGLIPPPVGRPNTFAFFISTLFGDLQDALTLWDFHADFSNPTNSTFTERPESPLAVDAFDPTVASGDGVSQRGSGVVLDPIPDRLMHRLQYRNLGTHESLVVNHTVAVAQSPSYKAGVRYYELRAVPGGAFGVAEQATATGAGDESRWMGSAAMDHQGNLAVGYSVSGSTVFPSIRYAGRLSSDPSGGLFQGEATLINGTGVQTDNSTAPSRWGDYSGLTVDPADDCTFWYTNEYYTATGEAASSVGWQTRIGTFSFPGCTAPPSGALNVTVTSCATHLPISGASVGTSKGHFRSADASGLAAFAAIDPETYTVTASAVGFGSQTAAVTVSSGATSPLDVCLAPLTCGSVAKPTVFLGGLKTPPGDDTLTFQGQITLPFPFSPALNPLANGVRVLIQDTAGSIVDLTIPGGALPTPRGTGWTVNTRNTKWTYQNKTPAPAGRIFQVVIQDKSSALKPGLVTFLVKGRSGSYAVAPSQLPLSGLIVFDPPATQCGATSFSGCTFNASGSRLTCK